MHVALTRTGEKDAIPMHLPSITPLIQTLSRFHPVSAGVEKWLTAHVSLVKVHKKKLLVREGTLCHHVYFIMKGAMRGYVREGIKDITTWISVEGEMVTSIRCLDQQTPSIDNLQAVEDCELLALSFERVEELYERYPDFNIVIRKLLQHYYSDAEGRALIARLTSAENKYNYFLRHHGHLANRVPIKYIASFLGITQETLSRVRRKYSAQTVQKH